jgi:N-acetylglucosaminyl-diphospho-decaprenol L-rhamnosyltransferase
VSGGDLGVVVLAYGGGGEHEPLLASLLEEGVEPAAVLVIHNPARPAEAAPVPACGCEVVQAGANLGYAGGMNLGLARMRERGVELVLLLTHDARLRSGALSGLRAAMEAAPDFGVLAPALLLSGTEIPFSFGGRTDAWGGTEHIKDRPGGDGVAACDWVDGGTLLVRRALVDRLGGFDERFWGYCEDSDLCLRVRRAGYGVGVVLAAAADQEPGSAKRPGAWSYLSTRNGIAYARRARGLRGLLASSGRALFTIALSAARTALRRLGLRPGAGADTWALAVGTSRGLLDYCRGRWGPPPAGLPGMGDLSNA